MSERKKSSGSPRDPRDRPPPAPAAGREDRPPAVHPLGTPRGLSPTAGLIAVAAWLSERGLFPPEGRPWRIAITLDDRAVAPARVFAESIDCRFRIVIRADEWGFYFAHGGRVSDVRITDLARAAGRDDHNLVMSAPRLTQIGTLIRQLEQRYQVLLQRHHAAIETSLPGSEPILRAWVASL